MKKKQSILIIGKPDSAKTTFKIQLLNHLFDGDYENVVLDPLPDKLSQIMEERQTVRRGRAVQRTQLQVEIETDLSLKFSNGTSAIIPYHDYSGEKIDRIIDSRIVSDSWAGRVKESEAWILFISPYHIKPNDNIYTKPRETRQKKEEETKEDFILTDTAYYIELIQFLLFIKGLGTFKSIKKPVLQVALSRCDKVGLKEGVIPRSVLKERLPLFVDFLESVWDKDSLSIIGISPTGKELGDNYDEEFINKGAHQFGYVVLPDGTESNNLTLVISNLLNLLK